MKEQYHCEFCDYRNGWCVFFGVDELSWKYWNGPYCNRTYAEIETKRLNDLEKQ